MLSNEDAGALAYLVAGLTEVTGVWARLGVAARKRAAAHVLFSDLVILQEAVEPASGGPIRADVARLAGDGIGIDPPRLMTGNDLIAQGWKPGPAFKRVLEEVFDAQLEGRVKSFGEARELADRLRV